MKTLKQIQSIVLATALAFTAHSVQADESPVDGTLALPHALHVVMDNKAEFEVTEKQLERFRTELLQVYPAKMRPKMQEISQLEKALREEVMLDNLSADKAQDKLKELGDLKIALSVDHINAMNTLAGILNESQWLLMLEKLGETH